MAENDGKEVKTPPARVEVPASPVPPTTHDVEEATYIICGPRGEGEREIPASQWAKYGKAEREWHVKHTNYTGRHHSDGV